MTAQATTARPADPCCLVIFGASGDLTHRLLVPALYNLEVSGLLPDAFALIGVARSESSNEAFRADLEKSLPRFATRKIDAAAVKKLLACVAYVQGDPDDPQTYDKIGRELARIESERKTNGNRLFYLATPPAGFAPIGGHLGEFGSGARSQRCLAAHHRRETVRHRSRFGARAQSKTARHSQGRSDFPHRPLSRQGDGAEHFGAALRQRPVRADLESRPYRSRADHGRGSADRRPPRQLL